FSVLSALSDPAEQLGRVEKSIAAIDECCRSTIFEFEIAGVASLVRARLIPNARHRPNAAHDATADEPHDIHVMRSLIQHHASARRQFMLHARPVHEFIVVPRIDHANSSQLAAFDNLAYFANRRIKAMGVATKKLYTVLFRSRIHGFTFFER